MKLLYYDCFSGISGDMNLAAMVDVGVDPDHLRRELGRLRLDGYEIRVRRDRRCGIEGTKVDVVIADPGHAVESDGHAKVSVPEPHAHDHGGAHAHDHPHAQHPHAHEPHEHGHAQSRSFADIRELITESSLSPPVKELSLRIFTRIADAEGKIHGVPPERVHFHEVGAVDSIVDIVGAAVCRVALAVDRVVAGPVELGGGFVRCAHGVLPVPAPATAEILRGVPARTGGVPFEATTPTGAAILATLVDRFVSSMPLKILKVGYGLGGKDGPVPDALRVFLAETVEDEPADGTATEEAILVECNLDDMSPERYDHVMELLFRAGAVDVFLTPIVMKKSRPAVTLSVLCGRGELAAVREILFAHTTTLGIREATVAKRMLERNEVTAASPFGEVRVKQALYRGRVLRSKPEYEDLKRLALEHGVSIDRIVESLRPDGSPRDGR
jgi:uncharacterized protein (TIGR00299 family) protein